MQNKIKSRPPNLLMADFHRHLSMEWVSSTFKHSLHVVLKRLSDDQLEISTAFVTMSGNYGLDLYEKYFKMLTGPWQMLFEKTMWQWP